MKILFKIYLIAVVWAIGLWASAPNVFAQNHNLQFNRAVVEILTAATTGYHTKTITVPAGKVWKIEQASLTNDDATPVDFAYNSPTSSFYVDSFGLLPVITSGGATPAGSRLPLWLPEGSYTLKVYFSGTALPVAACINAIEFNLVP